MANNLITQYRYKYVFINKNGREEPWTGLFQTKKKCDEWFEKYGKTFVEQGFTLKYKRTKVWRQPKNT